MTARVRVAHVVVQPVLVIDENDELTPGPQVQPLTVPLGDLAGVAELLRAEVIRLTEQLHQELAAAQAQEEDEE